MLAAASLGGLEVRRASDGAATVSGAFPYGAVAVLGSYGGVERRETFSSRAFEPEGDVYLLSQHEFAQPLASTGRGTLTLGNTDDELRFEARIAPAVAATTFASDLLALIDAGEVAGLSPGFRVPTGGERVVRTADGAVLRTVNRAELVELSIVTRPAFPTAQVEARSWTITPARPTRPNSLWVYR